jgi:hypothetical protein
MGNLTNLFGIPEKTQQSSQQQGTQYVMPTAAQKQTSDLLTRAMIGQMVNPPNTAISTPMQQAISGYQQMMPGLQQSAAGSLAQRLAQPASGTAGAGSAVSGTAPTGQSQDWTPAAGANQAGLQTRAQLGLPDRSSYFTFMPSAQQVADIGLAPVEPGGGPGVQAAYKANLASQQKQAAKAARQGARAQGLPKWQRKQAAQSARIKAGQGPSYL